MTDEATEALAASWASVDGMLDQFKAGKESSDHDGYYQGYLADAEELIRRLKIRGWELRRL